MYDGAFDVLKVGSVCRNADKLWSLESKDLEHGKKAAVGKEHITYKESRRNSVKLKLTTTQNR